MSKAQITDRSSKNGTEILDIGYKRGDENEVLPATTEAEAEVVKAKTGISITFVNPESADMIFGGIMRGGLVTQQTGSRAVAGSIAISKALNAQKSTKTANFLKMMAHHDYFLAAYKGKTGGILGGGQAKHKDNITKDIKEGGGRVVFRHTFVRGGPHSFYIEVEKKLYRIDMKGSVIYSATSTVFNTCNHAVPPAEHAFISLISTTDMNPESFARGLKGCVEADAAAR
jgi:hypothetical protein